MILIQLVDRLALLYTILLFARIIGSWVPEWRHTKPMLFVALFTDPYLNLFRKILPPIGMIDLSPIIALLCLGIIEQLLKSAIYMLFVR